LASAPDSTTAGPRDEVGGLTGWWSDWAFGGFGVSIGRIAATGGGAWTELIWKLGIGGPFEDDRASLPAQL